MRELRFLGTAKDDLSAFPESAKTRAGYELFMVQVGRDPDDWKPMPAVFVLHAVQKKSQKTARRDIELARARYRDARDEG